jgi:gas vesicle protein
MSRADAPRIILMFFVGVGVGAATALLLAPKAGERLRGDLVEGMSNGVNQLRRTGKDLKKRTQEIVALATDQVQDAVDVTEKAFGHARKA